MAFPLLPMWVPWRSYGTSMVGTLQGKVMSVCLSLPLPRERNIPFFWSTNVDPLMKLDITAITIPATGSEISLGSESKAINVLLFIWLSLTAESLVVNFGWVESAVMRMCGPSSTRLHCPCLFPIYTLKWYIIPYNYCARFHSNVLLAASRVTSTVNWDSVWYRKHVFFISEIFHSLKSLRDCYHTLGDVHRECPHLLRLHHNVSPLCSTNSEMTSQVHFKTTTRAK